MAHQRIANDATAYRQKAAVIQFEQVTTGGAELAKLLEQLWSD
jgi:hypothetical protein